MIPRDINVYFYSYIIYTYLFVILLSAILKSLIYYYCYDEIGNYLSRLGKIATEKILAHNTYMFFQKIAM